VYAEQTAPLISYYQARGLVRDIVCDGHIVDENHALVRQSLGLEG
jgi:hypothetical protein